MALGVPDWISEISSILGFWTIVGIITFLILCWRRIYYVYNLRDARRDARRRIQSIQDEICSLRGLNSDLDSAISRALHSSILDQERRLDIVSETKDSLWSRISALFRADPCLRRLEELEEDLKQKFERMTDVRLIILGAYNARQTDVALPTAEMSSRQTQEAGGATRQPAESNRTFSSGHSTTAASIGASTDNPRHSPRPEILALGEVGAVDYMRDPIEAVMDWQGRQVEGFKQTGLRKRRTPGVTWELSPAADDLSREEDNQRPRRIPTPSPSSRRQ